MCFLYVWRRDINRSNVKRNDVKQSKFKSQRKTITSRKVEKNMKYMNNYFGQSNIFGKARCKLPMNLQLFADSGDVESDGAGGTGKEGSGLEGNDNDDSPTVEELMAQLAEERAKSARLQNEKDTASSEAANFKKQLRAKMTANEQEEAAKAEAEAAKDARIQELESKFRLMDYSKRFMGVGMDETSATELAGLTGEIAEPDKFFSALDKFVKATIKKAGEDSVEALIKSNPSIKAGNGDGGGESLAVRKAKELSKGNRTVNQDILKNYM